MLPPVASGTRLSRTHLSAGSVPAMRWRLPALALSVRLTDHERLSVSSTSVSRITGLDTYDIRFPTSRELDGSDAMNTDPDYSAAYLVLRTDSEDGLEGHGFAFTIGRGNDVQVAALDALRAHVVGRSVEDLCDDPGSLARDLTGDSQLRWLGPEKGVMHWPSAPSSTPYGTWPPSGPTSPCGSSSPTPTPNGSPTRSTTGTSPTHSPARKQ